MPSTEEISLKNNLSTNLLRTYTQKLVSSDEAVKHIKSGDNIIVQPGCAAPNELIRALVRRKDELENVTLHHILIVGDLPYFHLARKQRSAESFT